MTALAGQVAVVTGASSGIGRAIAVALATAGARLCLVGRRVEALQAVAAGMPGSSHAVFAVDLADEQAIRAMSARVQVEIGRVDVLVHSAGAIKLGRIEAAPVEDFDWQFAINVRAPYVLTQALLPLLIACRGQVVFINSTAGLTAGAGVGQYAATKHALHAVANSLRDEVNAAGVRVLSVFPGRTASPMQEAIHRSEGKAYYPEDLMQPEDVAAATLSALALPRTAELTEIRMRPLRKPRSQ